MTPERQAWVWEVLRLGERQIRDPDTFARWYERSLPYLAVCHMTDPDHWWASFGWRRAIWYGWEARRIKKTLGRNRFHGDRPQCKDFSSSRTKSGDELDPSDIEQPDRAGLDFDADRERLQELLPTLPPWVRRGIIERLGGDKGAHPQAVAKGIKLLRKVVHDERIT